MLHHNHLLSFKFVVGVTGVEPVMRESKSRALPLGDTPALKKQTQITQTTFTALSACDLVTPRRIFTAIFC